MGCQWIKMPGGGAAVIRYSGKQAPYCQFCHERPTTKLCDHFNLVTKRTCDAAICSVCATSGGKNIDYCPQHKADVEQGALFG